MKISRNILRVLTVALVAATVVVFFFSFTSITVQQSTKAVELSGAELAFGTDVTGRLPDVTGMEEGIITFKSGWYWIGFFLSVITLVVTALGFKFRKAFGAAIPFAIIDGILLLVFNLNGRTYIDTGRIGDYFSITNFTMTLFSLLSCLLVFASVLTNVAAILINDRMEVLASKGTKLSIPKKIARFFRDYKGEIKKIVWPTGKTVFKNTVIVIVMCLVIGAFIWLLDWGLSELLKLVLNTAA